LDCGTPYGPSERQPAARSEQISKAKRGARSEPAPLLLLLREDAAAQTRTETSSGRAASDPTGSTERLLRSTDI
jgi:hypothetical protein